jgi:hypothetical protein
VQTVAAYPALTEPFHSERSKAWLEVAGEPITSTTTLVAEVAAAGHHQVAEFPEFDFDFVDREIFPLRSTTIPIDGRGVRRSVDFLLRAGNGGNDEVVVLGEAAELVSAAKHFRSSASSRSLATARPISLSSRVITEKLMALGSGMGDQVRPPDRQRHPPHCLPPVERRRRRSTDLQAPVLNPS